MKLPNHVEHSTTRSNLHNQIPHGDTFDIENRFASIAVNGQTAQFIYDGDGNLVKKLKPNGSKTIYVGGVYEVDKPSGGSVTRQLCVILL